MTRDKALEWLDDLLVTGAKITSDRCEAIRRAIAIAYAPIIPPPNTRRVRVAVAVGFYEKGDPSKGVIVGSCGVDECDDQASAMMYALDHVADSPESVIAQAIIEADIPLIPTVEGRVVEGEPDARI